MGSDTVTTLFVNYKWRKIIAESLLFRYDYLINELSESDEDNASEQIQGLIDDLYTREPQTVIDRIEARRLTTQAIAANTDTAIFWDAGDFDAANPTRLIMPVSGLVVVSANIRLLYGTGTQPLIWMRANGLSQTDVAIEHSDASILQHRFNETWTFELVAGQYLELWVNTGAQPATLQSTAPTPRFAAAIISSE